MRYLAIATVAAGVLLSNLSQAWSNSLVLASQALTVDTDADSVPDYIDNAPGVSNNQADTDNDGIGDAIDPTPALSNPYLGDPGLGVYSSPPILVGGTATFDYLVTLGTPPGSFGRVELDFDLDNTTDAIFFGPLTASLNTIAIPANFFVGATWDLNTPGLYTVGMKAYAPGMYSANWAYPNVTVSAVPEPSSISLLAAAGVLLLASLRGRAWRSRGRA